MIYSIWDQAKRRYDYFEAPGAVDRETSAPRPGHLRDQALGVSPERAAWPLPAGARPVGSGNYARGMIASRESGGMSLGFFEVTPTNMVLWGVIGYLAWKFVMPALREQ